MTMMTFDRWDVVEVPFPFVDRVKSKTRKAIVVSDSNFQNLNSACILMMITSATHSKWFGDTPIRDLESAGLKKGCVARLKIFTLQESLIRTKVGQLSSADQERVDESVQSIFSSAIDPESI